MTDAEILKELTDAANRLNECLIKAAEAGMDGNLRFPFGHSLYIFPLLDDPAYAKVIKKSSVEIELRRTTYSKVA